MLMLITLLVTDIKHSLLCLGHTEQKSSRARYALIDFFEIWRNLAQGASKISKAPPGVRVSIHTNGEAREQVLKRGRSILCKWGENFMQIGREESLVASDSCLPRRQLLTNTNQDLHAPRIWPSVAASHARLGASLCAYYYSYGQEMNLLFHTFEERGSHVLFGRSLGTS